MENKKRTNGIGIVSFDTLSLNTKEIKLRTYSVPLTLEVQAFGIANGSNGPSGQLSYGAAPLTQIHPPGHHVSIVQSTNLLEVLEPPHIRFLGSPMAASSLPWFLRGMMFYCCFRAQAVNLKGTF